MKEGQGKSLPQDRKNGETSLVKPGEKTKKGFGTVTKEKSAELASIAVAASAKAEIESAYIMAINRPRKEDDARIKIKSICKDLGFAEKAKYRKPIGRGSVTGPSIRFAEEMMRLWGNVKSQQAAIYEDEHKRVVKIVMIDLETNTSYSKEITIEKRVERKSTIGREILGERINTKGEVVYIVKATEDEILNKESALASKVIRNNGLRLIPNHIIEEAMKVVDGTLRKGISDDPESAKRKIQDAFAMLGVMPANLEEYLGQSMATISPAQVAELRDTYNAIKDGQTTWQDCLVSKKKEKVEPEKGTLKDMKAGDPKDHQKVDEPIKKPERK